MSPMPRFLRPCLVRLRLPALALLLLAVVANPLLAALGDLHELGSGSSHLHSLAEHPATSGDRGPQDDSHEGGGLLHALMHASHCCGHPSAVAPAILHVLPFVAASTAPQAMHAVQPAARLESLFRPPIAA